MKVEHSPAEPQDVERTFPSTAEKIAIGHAIPRRDVLRFCREHWSTPIGEVELRWLVETGILPIFGQPDDYWVLIEDLRDLASLGEGLVKPSLPKTHCDLFSPGQPSAIPIGANTRIDLLAEPRDLRPVFFPALRNLIRVAREAPEIERAEQSVAYLTSSRITTRSAAVLETAAAQVKRADEIDRSRASTNDFANSAYYMGSKHKLSSFIIESISGVLGGDGCFVDLMCGSGVVSGASARYWPTFSSDAQSFCRLLAEVQGGGFSRIEAQSVLDQVLPTARAHAGQFSALLGDQLSREDSLLHAAAGSEILGQYLTYHLSCPTYPSIQAVGEWDPKALVSERKVNPKAGPYLLFTAYFANTFLGLRQAVEVDSLRFAIDQLSSEKCRRWALGALVATVSRLATTYGGHFAQPLVRDWESVRLSTLQNVLRMRAFSVSHEFTIRFLNLAEESESIPRSICSLPGPWQAALQSAEEHMHNRRVVVYLDPPYKREEYSRYYHVLETLVTYSYPDALGKGRTPKKDGGQRFSSEFFTRNKSQMANALSKTISSVLRRGWTCAWSYSDVSAVEVLDVISRLPHSESWTITSFAAPHRHNAQGGRRPKRVTEYLVLIGPKGL